METLNQKASIPVEMAEMAPPKKQRQSQMGSAKIEQELAKLSEKGTLARTILKVLPDLGLIDDILTSTIINPRDMSIEDVGLRVEGLDLSDDGAAIVSRMITEHFYEKVGIGRRLPTMVSEALFSMGSYTLAIIPQKVIEDLVSTVNTVGSMESLYANQDKYSEPSNKNLCMEVVDDPRMLLTHIASRDYMAEQARKAAGMENYHDGTQTMASISFDQHQKADLYPMILKIPHDAGFTVHQPNDPEDVMGMYIMVDENGYPISKVREEDHIAKLRKLNENFEEAVKRAGKELGIETGNSKPTVELLHSEYVKQVDEELRQALEKKGRPKDTVEVSRPDNIYQLMFSRALSKKKTKLVWIDGSMVSYMAYSFTPEGYGESLISKTMLYSSLRVIALFTRIRAYVVNSTAGTVLNIELDEDDPDHVKTVHEYLHEYANMLGQEIPLGTFSPEDVFTQMVRSSIRVNIEGGEKFPGTSMEVEDRERSVTVPDEYLDEQLKKTQYSAFGVPPEDVDRALEGDFATSTVAANKLAAKRTRSNQIITEGLWNDFFAKYQIANTRLYNEIVEELKAADKRKLTYETFIECVKIRLPSPVNSTLESQSEQLDNFERMADMLSENLISEDVLDDFAEGDAFSRKARAFKAELKSSMMRNFVKEQGIMTDVFEILSPDTDMSMGKASTEYYDTLLGVMGDFMLGITKTDKEQNERIDKILNPPEPEEEEVEEEPVDETGDETEEEEEDTPPEEEGGEEEEEETPPDDEGGGGGTFTF